VPSWAEFIDRYDGPPTFGKFRQRQVRLSYSLPGNNNVHRAKELVITRSRIVKPEVL
jgi:hypothetical protein